MLKLTSSMLTESIKNGKQLYKYLMKECRKLPPDASQHYKFSIRQSYKQHVDETDPQRIKEIIDRAIEDSTWILNKYKIDKQ